MNRSLDRRSHARSAHAESDIVEIRRPAEVVAFPKSDVRPPPLGCDLLATIALDHARANEHVLARRAAEDALAKLESLASDRARRATAARAALLVGEAYLLVHDAHRAKSCFELAMRIADVEGDLAHAAQARVGLGKALLALHDPSARALLEDAGDIFEDIGDDKAALAIDVALRHAQAEFEESPRSFHARPNAAHARASRC